MISPDDPIDWSGGYYRIHLREQLNPHHSNSFADLDLQHTPEGGTILAGVLPDQAALHGIFSRVRDLGLTLLDVQRLPVSGDGDV